VNNSLGFALVVFAAEGAVTQKGYLQCPVLLSSGATCPSPLRNRDFRLSHPSALREFTKQVLNLITVVDTITW